MTQKSFHRIIGFTIGLAWASHLPAQQVSSGGITAAPSAGIDFSLAGQTIPARKQASDPATCVVGEQYFNTTSNVLKICTAANTWTTAGSGGGSYTSGSGIVIAGSTISVDTGLMLSQSTGQAGTPWKCTDAGTSGTVYSCSMIPAPTTLFDRQPLIFTPATSCAGGPTTLNVQNMGAKGVYKIDGVTNPSANDCRSGQPMLLFYNASLNLGGGGFQMASLLGNASFVAVPVGAAIASASTITPASAIHHVTGTTQINSITVPAQFLATGMGGCLRLIPDAAFTTGTSGNIAIASTAVVSRVMEFCYDNGTSKWYPSY